MLDKRLRDLREKSNKTQQDMADILGVSKQAYGFWETGKRQPDFDTVSKIATHYNVSIDYLFGRNSTLDSFSSQTFVRLPVLGVIRAGEPLLAESHIIGYEVESVDHIKGGEYFFLQVSGDSMYNPSAGRHLIQDGALVLIRQQDDVDNGEAAVVMVDDEATIKRVYKSNGQVILHADNTSYPPKIINSGDVRIIGKVVAARNKVD